MAIIRFCCALFASLAMVGNVAGTAKATTLHYTLEGDYGTEDSTSANVRGGHFRITAEFTPADLVSSTSFQATYENSGVDIEITGTPNDLSGFFAQPAMLMVFENPGTMDDWMMMQMPVLVDFMPAMGGGLDPVFVLAPLSVDFTDEGIVTGSPPGLPVFDDTNSIFSFLPALTNVATCTVTFHVTHVPEPSAMLLLGLGGGAFLTCCRRRPR